MLQFAGSRSVEGDAVSNIPPSEHSVDLDEGKRLELEADQAEWKLRDNENLQHLIQKFGRNHPKVDALSVSGTAHDQHLQNGPQTNYEQKLKNDRENSQKAVRWHNEDEHPEPHDTRSALLAISATAVISPAEATSRTRTGGSFSSATRRLSRQNSESLKLESIDDPEIREFLDPASDQIDFNAVAHWPAEKLDSLLSSMEPARFRTFMQKATRSGVQQPAENLTFSRLTYTDLQGNVRLRDVSGLIKQGEITGIFAAPDSNASVLLELLSNRKLPGKMDGSITYNNLPPRPSFLQSVGFIRQTENHMALLTVEEALFFSARLRLPNAESDAMVRLRVAIILKLLDLSHVANSFIGNAMMTGISGGQKRRLSVGMEMAAGHSVLLGDLITNGLDNVSAYNLIRTLRSMVGAGLAVACTVVQAGPELTDLFHRIIVLSKGTVIYSGPPSRAVRYFDSIGFIKPDHKSVPQFLEELSAEPESFYQPQLRELRSETNPSHRFEGVKLPTDISSPRIDDFSADLSLVTSDVAFAQKSREYSLRIDDINKTQTQKEGQPASNEIPVKLNERRVAAWYAAVEGYQQSIFYAGVREDIDQLQKSGFQASRFPKSASLSSLGPFSFLSSFWYNRFASSPWLQFRENLRRQALVFYRQRSLWRDNWLLAIFMGFLIGSVFYQLGTSDIELKSRVGLYFYLTGYLAFNSLYLLPVLLMQRPLFYMEVLSGYYTPSMYYFSFMSTQMVVLLGETLFLLLPVWGLVDLSGVVFGGNFWFDFLCLVFAALLARNWIVLWIFLSPSETFATTSLTISFYLFALFSGGFIPKPLTPAGWSWFFTVDFFNYELKSLTENDKADPDGLSRIAGWDTTASKWTDFENVVYFFLTFSAAAIAAVCYVSWSAVNLPVLSDFTSPSSEEQLKKEERLEETAREQLNKKVAYLEFRHLNYWVIDSDGSEKQILKDVSGAVTSQRFVALMGKSGAGKTTLLDVLAQKKTAGRLTGDILFNGLPVNQETFSRYSGYVEQFNSHNPLSTVREAIYFSARLRLPSYLNDDEVSSKVDHVIDVLNLRGVQNAIIGFTDHGGVSLEISKKITIAVELVMEPMVLLLDEPTTGLDSAGAFSIMRAIRGLSSSMAVICTIHQPSIELIQFFQDVFLLDHAGGVVYSGRLSELPGYFKSQGFPEMESGRNISDFALEIVEKYQTRSSEGKTKRPDDTLALQTVTVAELNPDKSIASASLPSRLAGEADLRSIFFSSPEGRTFIEQIEKHIFPPELAETAKPQMAQALASTATFWMQLSLLTRRFFLNIWRNRSALEVRYFFNIVLGLMVGSTFAWLDIDQSRGPLRIACLFFIIGHFLFSAAAFFGDIFMSRVMYFREFTSRIYTTEAYYLARFLAELPYVVVECFIPTLLIYFISHLNDVDHSSHYGYLFWCAIIVRIAAILLVQFVASFIAAPGLAYSVLNLILYSMLLLTGFFVPANLIPDWWKWLADLDFLKYALQFLVISEFDQMNFTCDANDANNRVVSAATAASYEGCDGRSVLSFANPSDATGGTVLICQFSCGDEYANVNYGIDTSVTWQVQTFAITHCFAIFFFIIGYLALKFCNHVRR